MERWCDDTMPLADELRVGMHAHVLAGDRGWGIRPARGAGMPLADRIADDGRADYVCASGHGDCEVAACGALAGVCGKAAQEGADRV